MSRWCRARRSLPRPARASSRASSRSCSPVVSSRTSRRGSRGGDRARVGPGVVDAVREQRTRASRVGTACELAPSDLEREGDVRQPLRRAAGAATRRGAPGAPAGRAAAARPRRTRTPGRRAGRRVGRSPAHPRAPRRSRPPCGHARRASSRRRRRAGRRRAACAAAPARRCPPARDRPLGEHLEGPVEVDVVGAAAVRHARRAPAPTPRARRRFAGAGARAARRSPAARAPDVGIDVRRRAVGQREDAPLVRGRRRPDGRLPGRPGGPAAVRRRPGSAAPARPRTPTGANRLGSASSCLGRRRSGRPGAAAGASPPGSADGPARRSRPPFNRARPTAGCSTNRSSQISRSTQLRRRLRGLVEVDAPRQRDDHRVEDEPRVARRRPARRSRVARRAVRRRARGRSRRARSSPAGRPRARGWRG